MRQLRRLKVLFLCAFTITVTGLFVSPTQAYGGDDLWNALVGGDPDLYVRYRYEFVNDDANPLNAHANTVRTALGYRTGSFHGFKAYWQLEDVRTLGAGKFNNTIPGDETTRPRPVVADPDNTEVNQAYLSYHGIQDTTLKLGRQQIIDRTTSTDLLLTELAAHRFIGNVVWRQNFQTFDAFQIQNEFLPNTNLRYAFLWNVNRIFSERHPNPRLSNTPMKGHLLNIKSEGVNLGGFKTNLEGYAYLLNNELSNSAGGGGPFTKNDSTKTFGGRIYGAQPVSPNFDILYEGEYANQSSFADGAGNNADYFHINGGFQIKPGASYLNRLIALANFEVLDSNNGGYGFQTQLATAHAFQGWADQFLVTPDAGIRDLYWLLKGKGIFGANFRMHYHRFNADEGGFTYGREFDFQVSYPLFNHYTFALKSAHYFADDGVQNVGRLGPAGRDTTKFWAFVTTKF